MREEPASNFAAEITNRMQRTEAISQEMVLALSFALKRLGGSIEIPRDEIIALSSTPQIISRRSEDGLSVIISLVER
jgi:hypothetical protein